MAALVELVVVQEVVGVGAFCPAAWGLVELVGEDADGVGDGDGFGVEEVGFVFPVEAGGGDAGVGEPVEGDVVEQVVAGEVAVVGALEDFSDEAGLAGAVAVVEREGCEVDG